MSLPQAFTAPSPLWAPPLPAPLPRRRPRTLRTTPQMTTLHPRRSKMILTRRVHTWTLKPPPTAKSTPHHPPLSAKKASKASPKKASQASPKKASQAAQTPAPSSATPTPAFIFRRPQAYTHKRRPADPPYRYLQLYTGHLPPTAPTTPTPPTLTLTPNNLFKPPLNAPQQPTIPVPTPLPLYKQLSKLSDRVPRLIVIGDVHGCITELQALLKLANYTPGDQILLLGDLVAKGPDSVAVVQLARELGARAVRGNHDYEVVRWSEIRKHGGRNDVSVEHARIARNLSPAEHAWLMDCPWFIESPEMNYLFVHAGFIPGVKLTQQNPRLMMNMRSVMKDGTVTARNVVGCEWGRLWQGPQTVVFGHDAYRGMQRYDYAVGIDTGCVYGGRLTALLLPENRLVSVAAKRAYISPKRFRPARENSPRVRENGHAPDE